MTLQDIALAWRQAARDAAAGGIPVTGTEWGVPVIFPDGSPVRRVEHGFVGGRSVLIVSGEVE